MILLTKKRQELGWSKAELGRRSGLDGGVIGRIESLRFRPYESQIKKIAKALGIPAEKAKQLVDDVDGDDDRAQSNRSAL